MIYQRLHHEYGKVFSVNLGPNRRCVVVSDVAVLKELFQGTDALTARPPNMQWINKYFRFGNGHDSRGLLFSQGQEWAEQRKFALRGTY